MKIIVSGKFSDDVFDSARQLVNDLRDFLEESDLERIETPLPFMVFFPVIAADELGLPVKSHRSYSPKERTEFVNVEIPHRVWLRSDAKERRRLLVQSLESAIIETDESKLPSASKLLLIQQLRKHAC